MLLPNLLLFNNIIYLAYNVIYKFKSLYFN